MNTPSISYDDVPYLNLSFQNSFPAHLGLLATLMGLNPAPPERCRVLELGCAAGANLLPMAYALPDSVFVGIDLSQVQIDAGQSLVQELGLKNLLLEQMNITEIGPGFGEFDYILAHGVLSWVPEHVQRHIMAICRDCLAPHGVAYISYNTEPGWRPLHVLRDILLYHTRNEHDPRRRAAMARHMLGLLADNETMLNPPYSVALRAYAHFLRHELDTIGPGSDAYLLHDLMESVNRPFLFADLMELAQAYGLQYLAESEFASSMTTDLPREITEKLHAYAGNIVELEQYLDFLRNRMFRMTLFCRADAPVSRSMRPERLRNAWVSSLGRPMSANPDLAGSKVERFHSPNGAQFASDHPVTKAAMLHLHDIWPQGLQLPELLRQAYERLGSIPGDPQQRERDATLLAGNMLQAFCYSQRLVGLHAYLPSFTSAAGTHPTASAVARMQVRETHSVTNLRHERVGLDDVSARLLPYLDGTRTQAELETLLAEWVATGELVLESETKAEHEAAELLDPRRLLERALHSLVRRALLVG